MKRDRKQIREDHASVLQEIEKLKVKAKELQIEDVLFSDEQRQFVEKVEHHERPKYARKPHWLDGKLVGRLHWKETFKDEDTGEAIVIDRQQVVRVDGEWVA